MNKRDTRYGNSENSGSPDTPVQDFSLPAGRCQLRLSLPVRPLADGPVAALLMDRAGSL